MLLAPLRRKRDELASKVKRTSDIPKHVIEECCCGVVPESYSEDHRSFIFVGLDEYLIPDCWREFVKACAAVEAAEAKEYSAALAR